MKNNQCQNIGCEYWDAEMKLNCSENENLCEKCLFNQWRKQIAIDQNQTNIDSLKEEIKSLKEEIQSLKSKNMPLGGQGVAE